MTIRPMWPAMKTDGRRLDYTKDLPNELRAFPKGRVVSFRRPYGLDKPNIEVGGQEGGFKKAVVHGSKAGLVPGRGEDPEDIVYVDLLWDDGSPMLDSKRSGEFRWFPIKEFLP